MTELEALQRALDVVHQAIYAYGLAGAHLRDHALRGLAHDRLRELEELRDRLAALVRAAGAAPTPAAAAYVPPAPVTDQASALALLSRVENAGAGVAWDLVAASPASSPARRLAVDWLDSSAVTGWQWTAAAGAGAAVPALPGQPA